MTKYTSADDLFLVARIKFSAVKNFVQICEFAGDNWLGSIQRVDILLSVMATEDHIVYYRLKSTDDLQAELAQLAEQHTIFVAQGQGSTNMQRDLRLNRELMNAIAYVLRERGVGAIVKNPNDQSVGITDFDNVII